MIRCALSVAMCLIVLMGVARAQMATTYTLAWDLYPNTSASDMMSLYRYQVVFDGVQRDITPACTSTECRASFTVSVVTGMSYRLAFQVACALTPTVWGAPTPDVTLVVGQTFPVIPNASIPPPANPCGSLSSPPPPPPPPHVLGPCTYANPSTPTVLETRPIGQHMQGYNSAGPSGVVNNQADRLRQLKAWGWVIVLAQFVPGGGGDKLFLIVECRGL